MHRTLCNLHIGIMADGALVIDKLDKFYFLNVFTEHGMDHCYISAYVPTIEKYSVC